MRDARLRLALIGWGLLVGFASGTADGQGQAPDVEAISTSFESSLERSVRLTLDLTWQAIPTLEADPTHPRPLPDWGLSEGRILDQIELPSDESALGSRVSPAPSSRPAWQLLGGRPEIPPTHGPLGNSSGIRIRTRIEAPLSASITIADPTSTPVEIPLRAIVHGPRTHLGERGRWLIRRVDWDDLEWNAPRLTGPDPVAPEETCRLDLRYNLLGLAPNGALGTVQGVLGLRRLGDAGPLWEFAFQDVIEWNRPHANEPDRVLEIPVPSLEGTYDLQVTLQIPGPSPVPERRRIWPRLHIRETDLTAERVLVRRIRFVVCAPDRRADRKPASQLGTVMADPMLLPVATAEEVVPAVEAFDEVVLDRLGPMRRALALGRSEIRASRSSPPWWPIPDELLLGPGFRERFRGWMPRFGGALELEPADPMSRSWVALPLRVQTPGRPHRLRIHWSSPEPSTPINVGLLLIAPGDRPRTLLSATQSWVAPDPQEPGSMPEWFVWPDHHEPILLLVNHDPRRALRIDRVELEQLAGLPAQFATRPVETADPLDGSERGWLVDMTTPESWDRFGGRLDATGPDLYRQAHNAIEWLSYCGARGLILHGPDPKGPSWASGDRIQDRITPSRRLDGQADADVAGTDRRRVVLDLLGRHGLIAWLELDDRRGLPGLPAPGTLEASRGGLLRVDRQGRVATPPSYQILHPEVQSGWSRLVQEASAARSRWPAIHGLLIRLGRGGTLPGPPSSGLDDQTYRRFLQTSVTETESAPSIPGREDGPDRFAARQTYVLGPARRLWDHWRAEQVAQTYGDLATEAYRVDSEIRLAVATPTLDDGPAGVQAIRADWMGAPPEVAWRALGLDLDRWPQGEDAPLVLRAQARPSGQPSLADDLARSEALDHAVAPIPNRGLLLTEPRGSMPRRVDGGLELPGPDPVPDLIAPLTQGLARLDCAWLVVPVDPLPGHASALRELSRTLNGLPKPERIAPILGESRRDDQIRLPAGIQARLVADPDRDCAHLVLGNETPYRLRVEARLDVPDPVQVRDELHGLRLMPTRVGEDLRLVVDLPPRGLLTLILDRSEGRLADLKAHLTPDVKQQIRAEVDQVVALYQQLEADRAQLTGRSDAQGNDRFHPNRHRVLFQAMQAYREERYAAFARLSRSRWARLTQIPPWEDPQRALHASTPLRMTEEPEERVAGEPGASARTRSGAAGTSGRLR